MADSLSIWTVYDRPLDYPEKFVARRWLATPQPTPTDDILVGDDLMDVRKKLPAGLHCISRQAGDDSCIVETWL